MQCLPEAEACPTSLPFCTSQAENVCASCTLGQHACVLPPCVSHRVASHAVARVWRAPQAVILETSLGDLEVDLYVDEAEQGLSSTYAPVVVLLLLLLLLLPRGVCAAGPAVSVFSCTTTTRK